MKVFIILFFCLVSFSGNAQNFFLTNYGIDKGLPSNQVYDVVQDHQGFIWIATDAGVSRFDGAQMVSFKESDGLSDNAIVQMHVASDGTIWFLGFNKTFTLYKDSFYHYAHNQKLNETLQKRLITSFYPMENDTLLLGLNTSCDDPYSGIQIINGVVSSIRAANKNWIDPATGLFQVANCSDNSSLLPNQIRALSNLNDKVVVSGNKELVVLLDQQLVTKITLNTRVTKALLLDSEQNIWVGTYQGLKYFSKGVLTGTPLNIESKQAVSCILEDKDGSIWFGTFSNGLYQIPSSKIQYYSNLTADGNNDFRGLLIRNNDLFSYNRNNSIVNFSVLKTLKKKWEINVNDNISQLLFTKNSFKVLTENQFDESDFIAPFKGIAFSKSKEENTYWIGGLYYFSKIQNDIEVFNSVQIDFQERVNCLLEVADNHLWLGTVNGLYEYKNDKIRLIDSTLNKSISCISAFNNSIVFGTSGNGLGILENDHVSWKNESNGLSNNFITSLFTEMSSIWVGTKSGLNQIKADSIIQFNRYKGLNFDDITAIESTTAQLILATSKGILTIEKEWLKQLIPAIDPEIKLNGKTVSIKAEYTFNYDQQNIQIELLAFDYFQKNKLNFRYRLNSDTSWSYTHQRTIRYESLPPGTYFFEVQAQNRDREWSNQSASFSFTIRPPFYQTTWFYALIALMIAVLFYAVLRWQLDKSRKRMEVENELSDLKIRALSAQMNPHFIFNSLNSIQNFLIDSDIRKSNKYLTKFAKLMRLVLNNSDKTFVPIKDVLSSLDLYLELEKMRFNDRFQYQFNIDLKIELETTHIPSMLIQPFVENAILHGILPREGKGNITVSLEFLSDNSLLCFIEDDGVGREFHAGKLGTKHKSQGLRITQERLAVFKQLFKNDFQFEFHDLKDEFGKPKGTKVELRIPRR